MTRLRPKVDLIVWINNPRVWRGCGHYHLGALYQLVVMDGAFVWSVLQEGYGSRHGTPTRTRMTQTLRVFEAYLMARRGTTLYVYEPSTWPYTGRRRTVIDARMLVAYRLLTRPYIPR
jgi:hypothetical protein